LHLLLLLLQLVHDMPDRRALDFVGAAWADSTDAYRVLEGGKREGGLLVLMFAVLGCSNISTFWFRFYSKISL